MTVASSRTRFRFAAALVFVAAAGTLTARAFGQPPIDVDARLAGFDDYMAQVMKDWNAPGIGVGIVVKDKLVFAKGYGFRDYGNKLPYTPTTTQPIASNSKLFTAVAAGLLVEEGKLRWDEPIKRFVPAIRFYNDELDRSVTIRDMLSHRTGVTRHDAIWYKSTFSRRDLLGSPALPRTRRTDSHDLPLQQLDVYGGGPGHRGVERADLGAVRQAPDLRPARNVALHPDDRGQPQGTGAGGAVLRAPRQRGTLPAAVLHGGGRHCAGRRDQLQRAGPVPMGHRAAQRRHSRWKAADPECGDQGNDVAVARDAERRARESWMGREPEPVLRHGPLDFLDLGVTCWRSTAATCLDSTRRSRSCRTIPSA